MLAAYCRPRPPITALVFSRRHRMHAHPEPLLVLVLELDLPVDHGEQRVVGRAADVRPGMELRAALPDDDRARGDELPGKAFHAEVLGPGVAAVAGGTDTLLVCHASVTQSLSLTSAIFTSVPGVAPISAAAREPVDLDLLALAVAHDLGRDLGALHHRFPRLHVLAVAREQHAIERHLAPGLRLEQRNLDRDSRLGAKLRATGREDGIAHRARTLISTWSSVKPPHTAR